MKPVTEPVWISFRIPYQGHVIQGEYRLDGRLIFVRDQRGSVKMKERGGDPIMKDARLLLIELAYGL
jgi:hypothetical protein